VYFGIKTSPCVSVNDIINLKPILIEPGLSLKKMKKGKTSFPKDQ
jgi:hypothetical protein